MNEKSIYILLTDTGTWFSKMIKFYTRFPYNHISIALDEGLDNLYSFGRRVYRNPFSGGFVKERMDQGVFFHQKETKCVLYKMTVNEEQYNQILRVIYQFESFAANYKYNLLGIFAIAVNLRLKRDNAYTCSQFVATVLNMSGFELLSKCPELMRPDDFLEIPSLELIYEGKLHEYHSYFSELASFGVRNAISV
ncbi:hypothetical protein [Robertmurraya andreesenii]|uniref:Permuted papain-like amidase enzyme, YaeF/YiiX, C92 family n=1 Tax=Anoxybacillus andreesenii TaxID=1325932 RepID=A0ABT9V5D8_9BACL|nr:hypothetical protein [Robertmurraya andreesenii]MDQ0156172.1 hypothetical protein [Robertmurraya andreesenii]